MWKKILIIILLKIFTKSNGREFFSKNLFHNKVIGVKSTCTEKEFSIEVKLKEVFTGSIYARGYPGQCVAKGTNNKSVTLQVTPDECGVRILEDKDGHHSYKLLIYVQYDKWVQQVSDEQIHVTCDLTKQNDNLGKVLKQTKPATPRKREAKKSSIARIQPTSHLSNITSKLQQMVQKHFTEPSIKSVKSHQVSTSIQINKTPDTPDIGGTFKTFQVMKLPGSKSKHLGEWTPISALDSKLKVFSKENVPIITKSQVSKKEEITTWMDIVRGTSAHGKSVEDKLTVGETASLVVRVKRVPGLDTRVTSCHAHDGSNNNAEQLIDENGCAVDKSIMPDFKIQHIRSSKEFINYSPFEAFKFPDHNNIHFRCVVLVCAGSCGKLDCSKFSESNSSVKPGYVLIDHNTKKFLEKTLPKGKIVDKIEIFNAVEVQAPGLDNESRLVPRPLKEERNGVYCVSSNKLMASFGILLSILLLAILSAIFCCVREKMRRARLRKAAANRMIPRLPRISHLPPTRFHGLYDSSKISHLSSPYQRFPH